MYRWVRSAGEKLSTSCRLVILMYAKHMGYVDRLDKNVSLSRLRLKRCMKRYHRALFVWYIAIVLNNIMVLFSFLFADIDELRKSKQRIGYKHWFQNALGNGLIKHGIKIATESLQRETTAAAAASESGNVRLPTVTSVTPSAPATPSSTNMNRRSARGNVLRNTTNSTEKRSSGRPSKRSRGRSGGRPRTAVCERCVTGFTLITLSIPIHTHIGFEV